mmetsp:Transcript_141076/g.316340  ORF Transcript_141076/g.316340 Transcript_141076/m.316340 type:complete len:257 (-) Transcript_141076:129-899(-)
MTRGFSVKIQSEDCRNRVCWYVMEVKQTHRSSSWEIRKRYSDFVELVSKYEREVGRPPPHQLPPKGIYWLRSFGSREKQFLKDRREALQAFLDHLLSAEGELRKCVNEFLRKPGSSRKRLSSQSEGLAQPHPVEVVEKSPKATLESVSESVDHSVVDSIWAWSNGSFNDDALSDRGQLGSDVEGMQPEEDAQFELSMQNGEVDSGNLRPSYARYTPPYRRPPAVSDQTPRELLRFGIDASANAQRTLDRALGRQPG